MTTLFILGNGFDRYHELPTSYEHYKHFLEDRAVALKRDFEDFAYLEDLENGDRWSNVERALELNATALVNDALAAHYPRMADDNPGWNDAEIDIANQIRFVYDFTGQLFAEWLGTIDVQIAKQSVSFPDDALFVTFNYTDTLETLYGVDDAKVLHVHGFFKGFKPQVWLGKDVLSPMAVNAPEDFEVAETIVDRAIFNHDEFASRIQFGTPENNPERIRIELERAYGDDEFYGAVIEPCVNLASEYGSAAFKDIEGNQAVLREFLEARGVSNVVVFGHSFDGIDRPYYESVFVPMFRHCHWAFVKRAGSGADDVQAFCEAMCIEDYEIVWTTTRMSFASLQSG